MKKLLVGLTLCLCLTQTATRADAQVLFSPSSGETYYDSYVGFNFSAASFLLVGQPQFVLDGRSYFDLSYMGDSGAYHSYQSTPINFGTAYGPHTVTWTFNGDTYGPYTFFVAYPVPAISALSQRTAAPGSPTTLITVTGTGFTPQSRLRWNQLTLPVTYVSPTTLKAKIHAGLLTAVTTANLTVLNPMPGGGLGSQAASFTVGNPAPSLAGINPSSAIVGSPAITLTATGSNFNSQSVILWNGTALTTTYLSPGQVSALISPDRLKATGTATVAVSNAATGGATTASKTFAINNPIPALASISPASAPHGSAALTITATGANFNASSTLLWKGVPLTTTYVSATKLTASVSAANLAAAGTAVVTVSNPAPGGGVSSAVTFTIN